MSQVDDAAAFAVVVLLAPNTQEAGRARDLVDSACHYEPRTRFDFVMVDDSRVPRDVVAECSPTSNCRLICLPNPRRGRGSGWGGGSVAGCVAALRWILQNSSARFVVLVDSDSLVIGPFATSIEAAFRAMPDVGYLGSNRRDSRGLRPPPEFQPVRAILAKLLQPFAVWMRRKPWRGIQCSAFGSWKRLRQVIELAVSRGYELGDFVHGGGSVIRREALDAIDDLGLLDDPLMWIETPIGGDVALSIYVAAAGYRFADFVDDGQVFAVQTTGLCDDPDRLIERGFSIVHSVKGDSRLTESQIREHFRLTRRRARP